MSALSRQLSGGTQFPTRPSHYATQFGSPSNSHTLQRENQLRQLEAQQKDSRLYDEQTQTETPMSPTKYQRDMPQQFANPPGLRPATSAGRNATNGFAINVESARQQQQQPVEYEDEPSTRSRPGSSAGLRPSSRATPVGTTLVPTSQYRAPSGTTLNKVPFSARARDQIARDQRETRERLRAKALDRRIQDAIAQEQATSLRSVKSGKQRAKSARPASASARHMAQQERKEQAFLSQREIEALQQPYEYTQVRPSSAGMRQPQQQQPQQSQFVSTGSATARPSPSKQPFKWGRAYEPADRPGQLVSSSTQSRLSLADIAAQPVAGLASQKKEADLATILGGGHEHVIFGNQNAPSAQTRQVIAGVPPTELPNRTLYTKGGSQSARPASDAQHYAPYATTSPEFGQGLAEKFNDDVGAVVVRDALSLEPRHASASLGYGKAHGGWRDYVAKPACHSSAIKGDSGPLVLADPFSVSKGNSILAWNTDGLYRGGSKAEILANQRAQTWSRTSGDYGGPAAIGSPSSRDRHPGDLPVAGFVHPPHEPLQLSYDLDAPVEPGSIGALERARASQRAQAGVRTSAKPHVHGPGCGHRNVPVRATQASGNPLNPYSAEQLAVLTARNPNLGAAAIGYGHKHPAFKTHILAASAQLQDQTN